MRKIFLACPYSHPDSHVIESRFVECNRVAARIVEAGHVVFSQVTLSHPINKVLEKTAPPDIGKMWAPIDAVFMDVMEELIIVDLDGWDKSTGIRREIDFYKQRNQNVSLWSEVKDEF